MDMEAILISKNRIEDELRTYGIEAENAFNFVLSLYVTEFNLPIELPTGFIDRNESIFRAAYRDAELMKHLQEVVKNDPKGDNLPVLYQHFLSRRFRERSGKFFTPKPIARAMASLLPLKKDAVVMDPACGSGTFLAEVAARWGSTPCRLVANDIDTELIELTKVVLALSTNKNHSKSYYNGSLFESNAHMFDLKGTVDYILANPPFSLQVSRVTRDSPLFQAGYRTSDALFLDASYELLKPGGLLVCLLPHSVVSNNDYKKLRRIIEERWHLRGVIGMPEGIFYTTSGTTARADIVMLEKSSDNSSPNNAFFAFAPSVGLSLNGRSKNNDMDDLHRIVQEITL